MPPLSRHTFSFLCVCMCAPTYAHFTTYCNGSNEALRYEENRTVTNSRDGCSMSGTSITVHLITHPFWSGPSSECGICHRVSLSRALSLSFRSTALQSFNFSTSLPLLLSESLYLSLSSAPGWFGRVTRAVSCAQAGPEFLTACCLYHERESIRV